MTPRSPGPGRRASGGRTTARPGGDGRPRRVRLRRADGARARRSAPVAQRLTTSTFSSTVSSGKSSACWKVRPRPRARRRVGRTLRNPGSPSKVMLPSTAAPPAMPDRALTKVVLPAPLGPMIGNHLARDEREVDVLDRLQAAEAYAEAVDVDQHRLRPQHGRAFRRVDLRRGVGRWPCCARDARSTRSSGRGGRRSRGTTPSGRKIRERISRPPRRYGWSIEIDEATLGANARKAPPNTAPMRLPVPPRTVAAIRLTASTRENVSGLTKPETSPSMTPARPGHRPAGREAERRLRLRRDADGPGDDGVGLGRDESHPDRRSSYGLRRGQADAEGADHHVDRLGRRREEVTERVSRPVLTRNSLVAVGHVLPDVDDLQADEREGKRQQRDVEHGEARADEPEEARRSPRSRMTVSSDRDAAATSRARSRTPRRTRRWRAAPGGRSTRCRSTTRAC